jgi:hypothetical protein
VIVPEPFTVEPGPDSSGLPPAPENRRLSEDLRELLRQANGRTLNIGQLEAILHGRGFALFILLLCLPFLFPIAIPGLSMPFGVVITLMGMRLVFGLKPSLPGFIVGREVPHSMLEKMVNAGVRLCVRMENLVKPRWFFLQRGPVMGRLLGLLMASGGIQLSLPLPPLIPLSNTIPAISLVFLTAGMVERDGILIFCGYLANAAAWVYFFLMFTFLGGGVRHLMQAIGF